MKKIRFKRSEPASLLTEPLCDLWEKATMNSDLSVIHSALTAFRLPTRGLRDVLVESMEQLANQGVTVALPAFTFSFCKGQPFHHKNSPSETGVLAQWMLESGRAKRTRHPIYSFAVIGPRSNDVLNCAGTTTFGDDSPFGYFERANARFVMMGCGWIACTQFHRYEELEKVPYRYFKEFSGQADYGDGTKEVRAKMYVRDLEIDPKADFSAIEKAFREKGVLSTEEFAGGTVESVSAKDLAPICQEILKANPLAWVKDQENARRILEERKSSAL